MPKISILLPVYNSENYIKEAVKSIAKQTFTDFELIIINDGSTDGSISSILDIIDSDKRIKIINKPNSGIIDSLNLGINSTDSELIARMDADDISSANRFKLQANRFIENKNLAVCGSNVKYFGARNLTSNYPLKNEDCKNYLFFSPCFAHPATMFKRSILEKNNIKYRSGYEHAEDYKIWVDISEFGDFENIQDTLLDYRLHPNQISKKKEIEQKFIHSKIASEYFEKNGISFNEEIIQEAIFGSNEKLKSLSAMAKICVQLYNNDRVNRYMANFLLRKTFGVLLPKKYD